MQSNNEKTETENLSPYEIFQLSRWGTIYNNCNPDEEGSEFDRLSTAELNYIFNNENPES